MTNILSLSKVIVVVTSISLFGCEQPPSGQYPHLWDPPVHEGPPPDAGCNMSDLFKGTSGYGGTATSVLPAAAAGIAPIGFGEPQTVNKFPGHMRKWSAPQDQDPHIITASIFSEPNPVANFVGPLTGIALWGSGDSATHIAEFDIPIETSFDPDFAVTDPAPFDTPRGGTMISVVGSSLEIRARNDAQLRPAGPTGDGANQNPIGFNGSIIEPLTAPALVSAALGKGSRATQGHSATKTIWAVNAANDAGALVPDDEVFIRIPPFAKSFRIARGPAANTVLAAAIRFAVINNAAPTSDGSYTVAAGVMAPVVDLSGNDATINIINDENDNTHILKTLYVIFFLSI